MSEMRIKVNAGFGKGGIISYLLYETQKQETAGMAIGQTFFAQFHLYLQTEKADPLIVELRTVQGGKFARLVHIRGQVGFLREDTGELLSLDKSQCCPECFVWPRQICVLRYEEVFRMMKPWLMIQQATIRKGLENFQHPYFDPNLLELIYEFANLQPCK